MPPPDPEPLTRWSMIDRLSTPDDGDAWRWFMDRYRPFAESVLGSVLRRPDLVARALDDFWGEVFASGTVRRADPQRRFRAFLVGTLRNFARSWQRRNARLVVDADLAADREPTTDESGEIRAFAQNVVQLALAGLERENPDSARMLRWFYGLGTAADGALAPVSAGVIGERLGKQANAVHVGLLRARQRLARLVTDELRQTVASEDELAGELDAVFAAMAAERPGLLAR